MSLSQAEQDILTALGAPVDAPFYVIFDQAAHLDYDWLSTFDQYFNEKVDSIFLSALQAVLLEPVLPRNITTLPRYFYSICEMSFLKKFVEYQTSLGNDVKQQIIDAGNQIAIIGGGMTSPDNMVCSGEGFIRNYLVGKLWLSETFPHLLPLKHCWIPDDFGHNSQLPVVLQALGLINVCFSRIPGIAPAPSGLPITTTNYALSNELYKNGVDFWWSAADGSQVLAHWLQGGYQQGSKIEDAPHTLESVRGNILSYINSYNSPNSSGPPYSGAKTPYLYVPMDNDFSLPILNLLNDLSNWNDLDSHPGYRTSHVYAIAATFDHFVALVRANVAAAPQPPLQTRQNFTLNPYWTGYYMSRPALKVMHYETTRYLLAAEVLGLLAEQGDGVDNNFWSEVNGAWADFVPSTHHDYVTGTADEPVYRSEQCPDLNRAYLKALSFCSTKPQLVPFCDPLNPIVPIMPSALNALARSLAPIPNDGETPIVIANPLGFPLGNSLVELPGPLLEGIEGIRILDLTWGVQPTHNGGLAFMTGVPSLGYMTGYLTPEQGSSSDTAVKINFPDKTTYELDNGFLRVTIQTAAPYYGGISDIVDVQSGISLLDTTGQAGNNLIIYHDTGNVYTFGNEAKPDFMPVDAKFQNVTATVLEQGPLRVWLSTVVTVALPGDGKSYDFTRDYVLVSGEPFLRMSTTGAAPFGCSVMTAFPLSQKAEAIVHGTPYHWTDVPLWTADNPLWAPPVFAATHHFLIPQANGKPLAAIYHPEVPAWAIDEAGVLIGCLLRYPSKTVYAKNLDTDEHTLRYAFRSPNGLGDPSTGQPLQESLAYAVPPLAAYIPGSSPHQRLPESYSLAEVSSPDSAIITAAKPGDVVTGTIVLRLYQPTNTSLDINVTLGPGPPTSVVAVTALEDSIATPVAQTDQGFTITSECALNTVQISYSGG